MESETLDKILMAICSHLFDLFVLRQVVIIPVNIFAIPGHGSVTPSTIVNNHVKHQTIASLVLSIVFPSNNLCTWLWITRELVPIHTFIPLNKLYQFFVNQNPQGCVVNVVWQSVVKHLIKLLECHAPWT